MPKIFQVKCRIERVSTLANNCLSVLLHTGDTSRFKAEELTELFRMANEEKEFWVAFSEMEIKETDLKIEEDLDLGKQKSPHKRLYDIILRYRKTKTGKFDGSRELYVQIMNKICENYLDKIKEFEDGIVSE
ncbi:MAG: hypothetical protein Q8O27_01605 [Enterobacteriaceae bacterium]|nr:hypothetical protein [Enterobacteriaceae bacterium]